MKMSFYDWVVKYDRKDLLELWDNELIINDCKLIIEVNGEQHYNANCGWNRKEAKRRGTTPEQALAD